MEGAGGIPCDACRHSVNMIISPGTPHAVCTMSDGQVVYEAFKADLPTPINIRKFSTIKFDLPQGEMQWNAVAPIVVDSARAHAAVHLASQEWQGVNALDGAHPGETLIVCGSGRSILKNVHEIERRPGVKVLAINGALKALPSDTVDYYFTLDWKGDQSWWSGVDWETKHPGIKAVLGLPTPPELVPLFSRRYYFPANYIIAEPQKSKEFAEEHGFLAESMLATHSVCHLAYRMGIKKVILLGHDFCITDFYYNWERRAKNSDAGNNQWILTEDIKGNLTGTTNQMLGNAMVVSATARAMADDGIDVINASQEGLLGLALSMPLDQALAYQPVPEFP